MVRIDFAWEKSGARVDIAEDRFFVSIRLDE
jgi:hypothetical protein